jgi:hypothetical protein
MVQVTFVFCCGMEMCSLIQEEKKLQLRNCIGIGISQSVFAVKNKCTLLKD